MILKRFKLMRQCEIYQNMFLQFLVAEQEAFQKEKLTEEYNDAYPFH